MAAPAQGECLGGLGGCLDVWAWDAGWVRAIAVGFDAYFLEQAGERARR